MYLLIFIYIVFYNFELPTYSFLFNCFNYFTFVVWMLLTLLTIYRIKTKCLINKSELNNKAHIAIAAAGCASSSSKIYGLKQKKFYRKAGGKVWYDPTMEQWSNG